MENEINTKPIHLPKRNNILFIASSVVFNLAVSGVYLAVKFDNPVALKYVGAIVVFLIIPFAITLIGYIKAKARKKVIIANIIILGYLLVEVLFDYILKIPFREMLVLHIFYILALYAAVFSMIGVARTISRKTARLIAACFAILIGCLIYLLVG